MVGRRSGYDSASVTGDSGVERGGSASGGAGRGIKQRERLSVQSWLQIAVVIALSAVAALPVVLPGFVDTRAYGDSPFVLLRLTELDRGIHEGVWFPRWAPDFAYGYGYPFFNYYASLAYYVAEAFHLVGFGIIASAEAAFVVGFLLAGIGMYLFARDAFGGTAAVLVSAAYTYAPFHLANVYLRGDALAEFLAYGLFPLILWAFRRLLVYRSLNYIIAASASYGALLFTHNISALLFTGVLAAYVVALVASLAWSTRGTGQSIWPTSLFLAGLAAALGLALAAFFWVPALREQSYVQLEHMTTGYFDFHGHFLDLGRLVSPDLIYDYNLEVRPEQGLPFRLGLIQTVLAAASLLLAILLWARARLKLDGIGDSVPVASVTTWHVVFFAAAFVGLAFLMSPQSAPVWDAIPLLPMVQFPWRLLSLASLCASVVSGLLLVPLATHRRLTALVLALALAALAFSATLRLAPERMQLSEEDWGPQRIFEYEYITTSIGTTCRYEYLPRWVTDRPWSSATVASYPEITAPAIIDGGGARVEVLENRGYRKLLATDSVADTAIVLGVHYFPGWMARVDGRDIEVGPVGGSGLLSVAVPAGRHRIEVSFGPTRVQELASTVSKWAVSVLAVLVLISIWSRYRWSAREPGNAPGARSDPCAAGSRSATLGARLGLWETVVPALVTAALAGVWLGVQNGVPGEPGRSVPFGLYTLAADVRSPLAHSHPDGIRMSDGWWFEGYEVSSFEIAPPARVTVRLHWRGPTSDGPSVVARLVSPTNFVLQRPWTYADGVAAPLRSAGSTGAYISEHEIAVPEGTPPGLYFIEIVLNDRGRAVPVLGSLGEPTDRNPLLGPFVVRRGSDSSHPGGQSINRLAEFGGMMALVAERVDPPGGVSAGLEVSLEWLALKSMSINYRASLRLVDGGGRVWGYSDGQMADGFYPTAVWQVGQRVRDLREVTPVPGTPPGEYYVELRVYRPSDGQTLEVVDAQKRVSALLRLGPVRLASVQRPQTPGDWQLPNRLEARCSDGLELVGYALPSDRVREGEDLLVTLGWLARAQLVEDHVVSVQLVDMSEVVRAEITVPVSPTYPSSSWQAGDFVRGQYALRVPPGVGAGEYRVRLRLADSSDCSPAEVWMPAKVSVEARARVFDMPATGNRVDVRFGSVARLVGYDVGEGPARAGGTIDLTLHWQALEPTEHSYKVFTHLVGGDGRIWGQKDDFPAQGTQPTSSWVKGEYIEDRYAIPIDPAAAPGDYQLVVGLYDLASGQRLPVVGSEGVPLGDHAVLTKVRLE